MCEKRLLVEVLFAPGCCCAEPAIRTVRDVLGQEACPAALLLRLIPDRESAIRHRFPGSPTVRVDGVDVEGPHAQDAGYGVDRCRIYAPHGECPGVPSPELVRRALYVHPAKRRPLTGPERG